MIWSNFAIFCPKKAKTPPKKEAAPAPQQAAKPKKSALAEQMMERCRAFAMKMQHEQKAQNDQPAATSAEA